MEGIVIVSGQYLESLLDRLLCKCVCVCVQGFDEFMNLVMDEAEEVFLKEGIRKPIGMYVDIRCILIQRCMLPACLASPV